MCLCVCVVQVETYMHFDSREEEDAHDIGLVWPHTGCGLCVSRITSLTCKSHPWEAVSIDLTLAGCQIIVSVTG